MSYSCRFCLCQSHEHNNMVRLALQAGDDEYSLLVNLKRLYELQLSKPVKNDSLFEDMYRILSHLRDMDNEVWTLSFLSLNTLIFSVQSAVASILSLFSWFLGEELSAPQYVPWGSMVPSCDWWWKPIWNIYWWTFIQAKLTFRSTLLLLGGPAYLSKRGEEHHCTLLQSKTSEFWTQNIKSMLVCLHDYIGLIDLFVCLLLGLHHYCRNVVLV